MRGGVGTLAILVVFIVTIVSAFSYQAASTSYAQYNILTIDDGQKGRFATILPTSVNRLVYTDSDLPFSQIQVFVTQTQQAVELDQILRDTTSFSGKAYKIVTVIPKNLDIETFANATLTVRVNRDWLNRNQVSNKDVALYQLAGTWNQLPLEQINSNEDIIIYTASVADFGQFVIGVEDTKPVEVIRPPVIDETSEQESVDGVTENSTLPEDVPEITSETDSIIPVNTEIQESLEGGGVIHPFIWVLFGLTILIVLGLVYGMRHK